MNLIEQLGGYECAKAEYDDPMYEDGELYTIKATGSRFFKHNLADELLQYRRQHNIFEHGDYIVWLFGYEPSHLYKVKYITDKGYSYGNDWGWYGVLSNEGVGYSFRHATDAEIKVGRRL